MKLTSYHLQGDNSDNSYTVVQATNSGTASGMRNLTITGGNASELGNTSSLPGAGGGIYINGNQVDFFTELPNNSSPTFTDCTITNNDAVGRAGGIYIAGGFGGVSSPTFLRCTISFNTAIQGGGGLFINAFNGTSRPTFIDTEISMNGTVTRDGLRASPGGAMNLDASGGVIEATFDRCLITRNSCDVAEINAPGTNTNSSAYGGAMFMGTGGGTINEDMVVRFRNSVVSNNTAYSGAGIYNNRGVVLITNTTVSGNKAIGSGGSGAGVYLNGGRGTIVNSLLWDNEVTVNTSPTDDFKFVNGSLTISYTLLTAANRQVLIDSRNDSGSNTSTLNDGPGIIYGQDPMFQTPGADVPTLQATSPAVNAGENSEAYTPGGDYLANERVLATVDLGAIESGSSPLPVELLSFTATAAGTTVDLHWVTASEVDLEGYHLLRSTDGGTLEEIAEVLAMGSGKYGFQDRSVVAGTTYYYQLRSQDFDGTSYLSDIVAVDLDGVRSSGDIMTQLYPNPTSDAIYLTVPATEEARTVYATVLDISGRKLSLTPLTSDGEHVIDVRDLPAGTYVLRLLRGSEEQSSTFTIQ